MTRSTLARALCAAFLCACAVSRSEQGGTNTNWLTRCEEDAECGEGSCECGLCSLACSDDAECGDVPGTRCLPKETALSCEASSTGGLCARACDSDADCSALPEGRCEGALCIAGAAGGMQASSDFAPSKGPAHDLTLPVPGERAWRYLDDDDTWRYVAPENPGLLYDAAYFDGRWFVLHGQVENSMKVTVSEINWLSWTSDGVSWETLTLTMTPYESYTRLGSNGASLLLAGTDRVAEFVGDAVVPIDGLDQDTAPPLLLGHPDGYAIARRDDVLWMDREGAIDTTYTRELAQFRAGVLGAAGFLLVGPFNAIASADGRTWRELPEHPCPGCAIVGLVYGNGIYLAADPENLFTSSDGESWQAHVWERALPVPGGADDEAGEDKIARIDFTGGHFTLHTAGGNTSLSADGVSWTDQLRIPLGQIGPAPCGGRCLVAGGRLLLPPAVLPEATPPAGADTSSPYYCQYGEPPAPECRICGGATVSECREGAFCHRACEQTADCPVPESGDAVVDCAQTQIGGQCMLSCADGETCPDGMTCSGDLCLYVFDDPRCSAGAP